MLRVGRSADCCNYYGSANYANAIMKAEKVVASDYDNLIMLFFPYKQVDTLYCTPENFTIVHFSVYIQYTEKCTMQADLWLSDLFQTIFRYLIQS